MHESDVVGIKNVLERRKNYIIILRQIRERIEELHYCSPDGGGFTVIDAFLAAWSQFHTPVLPALSPSLHIRCVSRKKSFKDVTFGE